MPARSQRTRAVLTFFAQDHASTEMVYANADVTKAEHAREVVAFADYWQRVWRSEPGLLCFGSKLTTYAVLDELRCPGHQVLDPARYHHPQVHEDMVHVKGVGVALRHLAVRNIGHDQPTLLVTNDLTGPAKDLFGRYADRL